MKKDVALQWIAALRSGKYEQGTGYLESSDGQFCCLGVLCAIAPNANNRERIRGLTLEDQHSVFKWAGLKDPQGQVYVDDNPRLLTDLNDSGTDFKTIADIIEKNIEEL